MASEKIKAMLTSLIKPIGESFVEAVDYMQGRKDGTIKSIKTPWESFNDAGMDGIEWHSMYVIAARPGVGKTLTAQVITREAKHLNPDQDFCVLHLQFEMRGQVLAQREMSAATGKSLKQLNSAEKRSAPMTQKELDALRVYAHAQKDREEYIVDVPLTVPQLYALVDDFCKMIKKPVIITLDHSMLVKRDATESSNLDTLYNLGSAITELKKKHKTIWLVLSQLNRSIENPERLQTPSVSNYPNDADVYGADALLQHCDVMLAINMPSKYHMDLYGPECFEVDPNLLAFHFLKVRSGDRRISFYTAEYDKMSIRERTPPPTVEHKKTKYTTK